MSNRIREFRKSKGLTMKELGGIIGVAESTISQYETGKRQPDQEVLIRIASVLNVSIGVLLGVEKEEAAPAGSDLFTEEEIQLLIKFRNTDEIRKAAIKALLESQ